MKKRFWKIEYSITIFVIFGVILLLIPTSFISSKEAAFITKWNDTYNKIDYMFTAMTAHADENIVKDFNSKSNREREQIMIRLVKPYLRIKESDEITKDNQYYFNKLYLTQNGIIIGIKDIKDEDVFHPGFIMMFDMNGLKGPNTWGKDIYGINIFTDGKITPIGTGWDLEDLKKDCSETGTGISCSHYYRIGGEFNE